MYHVSWSPFVSDYFLSCSADWSVKLWAQDKTAPLQSFRAAQVSNCYSVNKPLNNNVKHRSEAYNVHRHSEGLTKFASWLLYRI